MTNYLSDVSTKRTPQTEPLLGANQVKNSAGGFVFEISDRDRLDRFLVLGSEGGTYYVGQRELTKDNAETVLDLLSRDGRYVVDRTVEVSQSGRAPRNNEALFVLALAASFGDDNTRSHAFDSLPKVARTATHLFQFLGYCDQFRGRGRGLRRALSEWYNGRSIESLVYQVIKYPQRYGVAHYDVLNSARPVPATEEHDALFNYIVNGELPEEREEFAQLHAVERIKSASKKEAIRLIREHNLPREVVPTHFLNDPYVWEALLENMPMTALIRNLGNMTKVGLLKPLSSASKSVVEKLQDEDAIRYSRLHPLKILSALKIYSNGKGLRGSNSWHPVPQIESALDDAFYTAFGNVEPTGARTLLGVDVSSSMMWGRLAGSPVVPGEAAAAMAMVTARTEENYYIHGFTKGFVDLGITARDRLESAINKVQGRGFGRTDCSQPVLYALKNCVDVDVFIVYTDNETWAGKVHVTEALKEYRNKTGIPSKLVVVGMTSTGFSIADPDDPYTLDVVGFDAATPQLISDFIRG